MAPGAELQWSQIELLDVGDIIFYSAQGELLRLYATAGRVGLRHPILVPTVTEDEKVPALAFQKGGVADPDLVQFRDNGSGSTGVYTYAFDATTEEEVFYALQLPHAWAEATSIKPHVHWAPADTAAGAGSDVCWGLEYTWANINGVFGNTSIIYGDEQANGAAETLTDRKHYITALPTIVGTGKTISSMIVLRFFRDAGGAGGTDDYDDDAFLIEMDFHIEIDALGSRQEYTK